MPFADLGDVRLFYTDDAPGDGAADGTPVLLVHGFGADGLDWAWHIPALRAAGHRVIVPDLRGHGSSSAPEDGYRPEDLAGDLARLLDHLGVGRAVMFGHSMGAMVVTALALARPGLVRALVCADPGYGQPEEVASFLPALVDGLRQDPHAAVLRMEPVLYVPGTPAFVRASHTRKILATPAHVLSQAFPAMFTAAGAWGARPGSDGPVAARTCPVLTIWADEKSAAWENALLKHPASKAVAWPGSGHRLHEERPDRFLNAVKDWLEELDKLDKEKSA
ncbi:MULTISPECIES: alpha/beta fold hydrolase [Thermomonosporaceae]|uniref:alpha/beta fold hydrolase n=1 Tax=Thermomonosporaceae TaxID=2012 RepID=UPI00255B3B04|nr:MULTISPECIES: alpha/beta hydrolase [Thermomonosporaceae]MDL4771574.1 alpha/beta hydrolase [Actinomadura xylanilytica]